MKKTIGFCLLILCLHTASAQDADQKAVRQAITGVFDGLSYRDIRYVKESAVKDFIVLENGVVWNMDTIAAKVDQLRTLKNYHRDNYFEYLQTEVNGNAAFVSYYNTAVITIGGKRQTRHWLESAFLIKEAENWKVRVLHSTVITPAQLRP